MLVFCPYLVVNPTPQPPQPPITLRLVNGIPDNTCSGRVELYHQGQWGTVCDDEWDLQDAQVVCRQLSCGPAVNATTKGQFGQGSGDILMEDVRCSGNESSLTECSHQNISTHNCGHQDDAGVICEGECQQININSKVFRNYLARGVKDL